MQRSGRGIPRFAAPHRAATFGASARMQTVGNAAMQNIIIEKPYQFIPPYHGTFWSWLFTKIGVPAWQLRKAEGVVASEVRGIERLRESIAAGHGILITPNHPRTADPVAMGFLTQQAPCHVFAMASWHLFHQDWLTAWAIRMMGGFSVNRGLEVA